METKSRYQVIGELEAQKRALIKEKSDLDNEEKRINDRLKELSRKREDINRAIDRETEDEKDSLDHFQARKQERLSTIDELIKSVDQSLERLNTQKS